MVWGMFALCLHLGINWIALDAWCLRRADE
jgi:hypothetical protein